jgi:oxalate decarboxylase/phosphoglucose isomerase-like protein (cupin superfamily)
MMNSAGAAALSHGVTATQALAHTTAPRAAAAQAIVVGIVHRTTPEPRALRHNERTQIYKVIKGSGLLFTGGAPQAPTPVSDPPNLGPTPGFDVTQDGGVTQKVKAGDLVIIPAGLPHRFSELDGPIDYVVYRFETVPVR